MIPRRLAAHILDALKDFPVVYVNGPRQAGKSTLVQTLAATPWPAQYVTFDDASMLGAADSSPEMFLRAFSENLVLDEVQMAPGIFRALKILVDEVRLSNASQANGRFLLTGSADVLALPGLSDALVGRMSVHTLYPLAAVEVTESGNSFLSNLMANDFRAGKAGNESGVTEIIREAGFPELIGKSASVSGRWFESYITTILQREVRQIAQIEKLGVLPNLLRVLASRAGGLINEADIARSIGQNAVTAKTYRVLLQMLFLTFDVKPWYRNIGKRLVKSPKAYLIDTLLLCHLQQIDLEKVAASDPHIFGHIIENFVATELLKQLSFSDLRADLFHFRTSDGKEVDFVIEQPNGSLAGIEVKGRDAVSKRDFDGLRVLQQQTGQDFKCGVILYRGSQLVPFGEKLWAVPVAALWT